MQGYHVNGGRKLYTNLDDAKRAADRIYRRTGAIVAIVACQHKHKGLAAR